MRRRDAPGGAVFHFSLSVLNFSLRKSTAAAGNATADRPEPALRDAGEGGGAGGAGDRRRPTAEVSDEDEVAAGAGGDAAAGLFLGALLEVRFRPGVEAGRE